MGMGLHDVVNVYVIAVALHYACDVNMMTLVVVLLYTFGHYLPHDNLNQYKLLKLRINATFCDFFHVCLPL